ncbi:putative transcription factor interactor and regulator CCHC(Zn) family [Helianthus annuus]|nr:putative transcription factor interactor and regulator CCHC(Zn) family [Helianthus annuus]KAJ0518297.1 putative transcription factor interactor and regulator CCHC(Zn) family [Helianthus annuus]KAJ0686331.1 putative transcription factor interactor and regulator CCHC(Zn) family [Helianthus annuus]
MAIVPSKKMIAICQYGGDFDTYDDGTMNYVGGEAYAVDLDENMQLSGFKQEIAETIDLSVDAMIIKYFLPGNKKNLITVSKDKDFQRMVSYYKDADQLEVFIMKDSPAGKNAKKKQPARRPQKATPNVETAAIVQVAPVSNAVALNDQHVDIETTTEITPAAVPISSNPFPMVAVDDDSQRLAAKQWENIITGVGQRFHSLAEFREALRKYSIAHAFNFVYKKNENQRVTVKCKAEGCPWRIHASKLSTTQLVCIKTMRPVHNCQGVTSKAPFRAKRSWVGNLIKEKVKESPKIKPKEIATELKRDYGIDLNYSQARRAKEYAREQLLGSYKDAEIIKGRSVQVIRAHGSKFEVRYVDMIEVVDIENWDCSCKGWLLTGLPCCHAIAVLEQYGRSPYDHCSRYFHVEMYHLTYADSIHPIPNVERLMDTETEDGAVLVTPPPTMRTPGRTKIRKVAPGRIGPSDFLKRQLQCGKCKGLGHNKRSCKSMISD